MQTSITLPMNKVLLTTEVANEKTAASKARVDVLHILEKSGYKTLYFPPVKSIGDILTFRRNLKNLAKKDGHVMIEYPCSSRKRLYILYFLCKMLGIKLYGLIHDIAAIRFNTHYRKDTAVLKLFDGLISHNAEMTKWLAGYGVKKKIIDLQLFDYCHQHSAVNSEASLFTPVRILYAGNLSYRKATYLYDKGLDALKNVSLFVYGQFFEPERLQSSLIQYRGVFNPDTPQLNERYHFGLIWEGTSIDTCEGEYGNYLRFNNPHKLSLYISLDLPVIVWEEAAIAQLVKKHRIGITIRSLSDLEHITDIISDKDYREMVANVSQIGSKVRQGYFLESAVDRLVN